MHKPIGGVLVAVILSACAQEKPAVLQQGAPATDVAAVRQAIEAGNAGLIAAMEKGDSVSAASFYDPEAMIMPHGMPASTGHGEIPKFFGEFLSTMKVSGMKLEVQNVVADGILAVETGRYVWTLAPATGKAMTESGKYVVVWRKQSDGSWKLYRDIFNTDAPPQPSPAK
jgi:ketosteroid isomerase-like protein